MVFICIVSEDIQKTRHDSSLSQIRSCTIRSLWIFSRELVPDGISLLKVCRKRVRVGSRGLVDEV